MRRVWLMLVVVNGLLVSGCGAPPPSDELIKQSLVLTQYAPRVDFSVFRSFYLRPEIRALNDDGSTETVDPDTAQPLLDATERNLIERGYEPVAKADAELAVELDYLAVVSTATWCYSWWDAAYWGYPNWGYYPYYGGCGSDVWRSGLLVTHVVDLTEAQTSPSGGEGGAGGSGPMNVRGIWFSGIYGVDLDSRAARDGVDQAFSQSPYFSSAAPK